jgi:hypothetical protein
LAWELTLETTGNINILIYKKINIKIVFFSYIKGQIIRTRSKCGGAIEANDASATSRAISQATPTFNASLATNTAPTRGGGNTTIILWKRRRNI